MCPKVRTSVGHPDYTRLQREKVQSLNQKIALLMGFFKRSKYHSMIIFEGAQAFDILSNSQFVKLCSLYAEDATDVCVIVIQHSANHRP